MCTQSAVLWHDEKCRSVADKKLTSSSFSQNPISLSRFLFSLFSHWLLLHSRFVRVFISSRCSPTIRSLLSCFQSTGNAAKVFQFKIEREALRGLETRTNVLNIAWLQMEASKTYYRFSNFNYSNIPLS